MAIDKKEGYCYLAVLRYLKTGAARVMWANKNGLVETTVTLNPDIVKENHPNKIEILNKLLDEDIMKRNLSVGEIGVFDLVLGKPVNMSYDKLVKFEPHNSYPRYNVLDRKTKKEIREEDKLIRANVGLGINKDIGISFDELRELASKNILKIDFIKSNGDYRTLYGTNVPDILDASGLEPTKPNDKSITRKLANNKLGILPIFDLQKNEFRSVKYLSIVNVNKVMDEVPEL